MGRVSEMKKTKYLPLIVLLYTNFIFQGMAAIIISQNMGIFEMQWGASISQITLVISAIGLGRILSLNLAGFISDLVGRKFTVMVGIIAYIIFFIGILWSQSYLIAIVMAIFAGVGNAFLDTSTYPTVMEAFPDDNDSNALSVLNKAFISTGQFILPIATRFLLGNGHYYGWTFIVCMICLAINLVVVFFLEFPSRTISVEIHQLDEGEASSLQFKELGSKLLVEGIALFAFSFVSVSLFNVFIMWVPLYAERYAGVASNDSLIFVSIYSLCSFISVFLTSFVVKKGVNVPKLMWWCCILTGISIAFMLVMPSMVSIILASVFVGVFAAGGIWQLGLSVLLEFFPYRKGSVTSNYSLATSFSVMVSPYLTGLLAEHSLSYVFIYVAVLAAIGSWALSIVSKRYGEVFPETVNPNNHQLTASLSAKKIN